MGNFQEILRDELDYQDITIKELSAKSSVAVGAIHGYLSTQASIPSAGNAIKIANALGVSVEYLITGKDGPSPKAIMSLNPQTRQLLHSIEQLSKEDQQLVVNTAMSFAEILRTRPVRV
jgi:transcriptional regulator with XRE-family HTH domain